MGQTSPARFTNTSDESDINFSTASPIHTQTTIVLGIGVFVTEFSKLPDIREATRGFPFLIELLYDAGGGIMVSPSRPR